MNYTLRKANVNDSAKINELFIEMINTIYNNDDAKGYEAGYLGKYFGDGEDRIYVAEKDNEIIAFLSIEVYRTEGYIYLDDLSVTGKFRGAGIGTHLIGKAEEFSKEVGINNITLHVEKSNINARRLYEKLGYGEYKDEGGRLLLSKSI